MATTPLDRIRAAVARCLEAAGCPLPRWAGRHAERAKAGRLRSVIALKCGQCADWDRKAIALCGFEECPLHAVRPFQVKS